MGYVYGIPGTISYHETTACEVQFGPAVPVANEMTCAEEQGVAIAAGSTYIPRCQSSDSSLYDGCQCDIGDSRTMGVCYCVDPLGNPKENQIYQFSDETFEEVCVNVLSCDGTEVTVAESREVSKSVSETEPKAEPRDYIGTGLDDEWMKDRRNLVWMATATLAVSFVAIAMYVVTKCVQCMSCGNSKRGYVKQLEMADEEEEMA